MPATKWFSIHVAALVSLFVLWFATPAGFWAGLVVAVIIVAIGAYAMRHDAVNSSETPA